MKNKVKFCSAATAAAIVFSAGFVQAFPGRPTQFGNAETLGGGRLTTIAVDTLNQPHIVADGGSWIYVYDKIGGQWRNSSVDLGSIGYTQFYNPHIEIDADNRAWCSGVVFGANIGMAMFVRENAAVNPAAPLDGFSYQNVTPNSWGVGELSLDPKDPGHVYLSGSVGWHSRFVYDPSAPGKVRRLESNMRVYAANGGEKNAFWISKNTTGEQIKHVASNGYAREDSGYRNSQMGSSVYWASYSSFPEMGDDGAYLDLKSDNVDPEVAYIASSFNTPGLYMNIWNGSNLLFDKNSPLLIDANGETGLRRFAPQMYPANDGGVYIAYTRGERVMLQYVSATGATPWGAPVEICPGGRASICVDSLGDIHLAYTEGGQTKYRKIEISGDSGVQGLFDAVALQDGWYFSEWFGYFKILEDNWINHSEHGKMLVSSGSGDNVWLHMNQLGWVRTSASLYPSLYSIGDGDWIRYLPDSSNPRWFYRNAYDMWTTDQQYLASIETSTRTVNAVCFEGQSPGPQAFQVSNTGNGILSYRASRSMGWANLDPVSGNLYADESVTVNLVFSTAGLAAGAHSGNITVWAPGAGGTPSEIDVSVTVKSIPELFEGEPRADGWYESPWFGNFRISNGWIYQADLGWMKLTPSSTADRIWLWDQKLGWLRTSPELFGSDGSDGYFFSVNDGDWVALKKGSDPRAFWRFKYGMTISDDQSLSRLSVDSTQIDVGFVQGFDAKQQTFTVSNAGAGTLSYRIDYDVPWIANVTPRFGDSTGENDQISVTFNTAPLSELPANGTISVWAPEAQAPLHNIVVSPAFVQEPALDVNPVEISSRVLAGKNPVNDSFDVWNAGFQQLDYSISETSDWFSVDHASGSSTGEHDTVTVEYDVNELDPGNYQGTITVASDDADAFGSPRQILVDLTIENLFVSTASVEASGIAGAQPPADATFGVQNRGAGTMYYSIVPDYGEGPAGWIGLDTYNGASVGEKDIRTVSFITAGLPAGIYVASLRAYQTDPNGEIVEGKLHATITVTLTLQSAGS